MLSEIVSDLSRSVNGSSAKLNEAEVGDSSVQVASSTIKACCERLKSNFGFNVLQVISAVDYPQDNEIELNYILANFTSGDELILKTRLPRGDENSLPKIESVTSLWKAANWQEREAYDMMGIDFVGHPDPRRILCPYDWTGYPLRKDYVVQEEYNGMVVNPESKMNRDDHFFGDKLIQEKGDPKKIAWSWKEVIDRNESKKETTEGTQA
ncbi:MAG: NADH-quinone oxidoreductase subunit C [Bacteriovoracaceae bacterium]